MKPSQRLATRTERLRRAWTARTARLAELILRAYGYPERDRARTTKVSKFVMRITGSVPRSRANVVYVIDVILPVLDEAYALPWVLGRMPRGFRAVVVDNGSTDGSGEIARGAGERVVEEPTRGFGAACHAGLMAATTDVVCFMDCDGSLDPLELPAVCRAVGMHADLVLGARVAAPGAWPRHARIGNRLLTRAVRRRTGVVLRDLGPMRAAKRQSLLDLGIVDRRFGWPLEMVLRAAEAGWRIVETDVSYGTRCGRSKVTGTLRGTVRTARDMSKALAWSRP
jgi:hypothetical protein